MRWVGGHRRAAENADRGGRGDLQGVERGGWVVTEELLRMLAEAAGKTCRGVGD